jgi:hypothetical protein
MQSTNKLTLAALAGLALLEGGGPFTAPGPPRLSRSACVDRNAKGRCDRT